MKTCKQWRRGYKVWNRKIFNQNLIKLLTKIIYIKIYILLFLKLNEGGKNES